MDVEQANGYAKRTEAMIGPDQIALISMAAGFFGKLPVATQKKMFQSSSKKNPHMGFVVEPYAFFLCHEIKDIDAAQALLPSGFRVLPTRVFDDDEPRPYVIFCAFNAHTSAFWGSRVEMYVIAEQEETGLLTWVIVDYDTNTISYDPGQGFVPGNARRSTVTTTYRGTVLVDVESPGRRIAMEADIRAGEEKPLDPRLWIEGNLCVVYGGELDDGRGETFSLIFDPDEMRRALRIPVEQVQIDELTWHPGLFAAEPSLAVCFPYAQHFITSSVPRATDIRTADDLERAVAAFNEGPPPKGFDTAAIRRSMMIGAAVSALTSTTLLTWLILHYLLAH